MNVPLPQFNDGSTFPSVPQVVAARVHPVHQSGAIFSGLSNATTLTVNCNIYYEAFPSSSDEDILVLARPSNPYDEKALEYYSTLMQSMPVGVMVKYNGLGDWFAMGLSKLASSVGGAMSMLPGLPGMIGAGAKWIGDTLPQYIEGPTEKKNGQQKRKPAKQNGRQLALNEVPNNPWASTREPAFVVPAAKLKRKIVAAPANAYTYGGNQYVQTQPRKVVVVQPPKRHHRRR